MIKKYVSKEAPLDLIIGETDEIKAVVRSLRRAEAKTSRSRWEYKPWLYRTNIMSIHRDAPILVEHRIYGIAIDEYCNYSIMSETNVIKSLIYDDEWIEVKGGEEYV